MKVFNRSERVGGLIKEVLSEVLQKNISDPRLKMITITEVKVSKDLKYARIYFAILGGGSKINQEQAYHGFKSAMGYFKRELGAKLDLRYMPELKFMYDESFDYGSKIDKLLKSIQPVYEQDNISTEKE
ncbi:MAG: 30S ribosome-binding factor RbfA [Desulfobacterales bacterium]|nr:30S ribosome-binding factor RbfA [Desulfobacterales bacterium]MBF0395827.1 30S ribosome-binding factor RbfA [Desulfobacterales bacterium]